MLLSFEYTKIETNTQLVRFDVAKKKKKRKIERERFDVDAVLCCALSLSSFFLLFIINIFPFKSSTNFPS